MALHGVDVRAAFDSMLASYLLDPTRSQHRVADTAPQHMGYKAVNETELLGAGAKAVRASDVAPEALLRYAAERADLARQCRGGSRSQSRPKAWQR